MAQPNRSVVALDALAGEQTRELAQRLGAGERAAGIAQRAEGNPLFVEQLVAVGADRAAGELPASMQAVLAARIDRLDEHERTCCGAPPSRAARFTSGRWPAACPSPCARPARPPRRARPQGPHRRRSTGVRGRGGVSLRARADPRGGLRRARQERAGRAARGHRRLARGATDGGRRDRRLPPRAGLPACRRGRLRGRGADARRPRGAAAARRCARRPHAGRPERGERAARARRRAAGARRRGTRRAAPGARRVAVRGRAHDRGAGDPRRGDRRARDEPLRARAEVEREIVRLETQTSAGSERAARVADGAMPVLEQAGDDFGQARVWGLRAQIAWAAGQVGRADAAWSEAECCARRAGDERELFQIVGWRATAAVLGPTPVGSRDRGAARSFATSSRAARSPTPGSSARWHRCTRCKGSSSSPTGCCARPSARWSSSAAWARSRITKPSSGCSPATPSSPRCRCAPACRRSPR